jgi:N6-L-threonylcarbamoyladenine synthase
MRICWPAIYRPIEYPALGVLVSGGHTHIYEMPRPCEFTLLGKTLDDAAGEAFDKIANFSIFPILGEIHRCLGQARYRGPQTFSKPYLHNDNCDFSFSGLKTAVAQYVQKNLLPPLITQISTSRRFLRKSRIFAPR